MKAALLHKLGEAPQCNDCAEPVAVNDNQLVMTVKAASVKNLDKGRASGRHYASYTQLPAITGTDAVGTLPDGTRVYAHGISGTIAEKALINKNKYKPLPANIDFVTAAALPNAVIGAAMALRYRAQMKPGNVVLVNGATGVTGQLAVQIAKHYRAAKIIATGRNADQLEKLKTMGADITVSLKDDDDTIIKTLKEIHSATPIDIVIDYLWGHPVELIIKVMKGGGLHNFTHRVKICTVGSMAGEQIELASGTLRSSAIELLGSGFGSLSEQELESFNTEVLPEMFQLAADGLLHIDTQTAPLKDITEAWNQEIPAGKRLVIVMDN